MFYLMECIVEKPLVKIKVESNTKKRKKENEKKKKLETFLFDNLLKICNGKMDNSYWFIFFGNGFPSSNQNHPDTEWKRKKGGNTIVHIVKAVNSDFLLICNNTDLELK